MNPEVRRQSAKALDDGDSDEASVRETDHDDDDDEESESGSEQSDDPSEHDEQPEVVQSKRGVRPLCEIDPPSSMMSDEEGGEEEQSDAEETVTNTPTTVFVVKAPYLPDFQPLLGPSCG